MNRRLRPRRMAATLLLLVSFTSLALARSNNPPSSRTGAFAVATVAAEGNCTGCHSGQLLNEPSGSVAILGIPALYTPGATYPLTVSVTSTQTAGDPVNLGWGFEITSVRADNGGGAGALVVTDATNTVAGTGTGAYATRTYVKQTGTGNRIGQASPAQWTVNWVAPDPGVGRVYFFAAGLAADGDGGTSGDWVYTVADTSEDLTTPVETATWGAVKARYRR